MYSDKILLCRPCYRAASRQVRIRLLPGLGAEQHVVLRLRRWRAAFSSLRCHVWHPFILKIVAIVGNMFAKMLSSLPNLINGCQELPRCWPIVRQSSSTHHKLLTLKCLFIGALHTLRVLNICICHVSIFACMFIIYIKVPQKSWWNINMNILGILDIL